MAFHKEPEKWMTGAYIKIGRFGNTDSDLLYQDEVHGSLIEQIDKAMEIIYSKYSQARIRYEGILRIEQYIIHPDAFREILLNAIVHKDYNATSPIQVSVYEEKIYVWNEGRMPESLSTTEKLYMKHASKPFNPKLAEVFFKAGLIEAWGRGFDKIKEVCSMHETPLPQYEISEDGIMVKCKASDWYIRLAIKDATNQNNNNYLFSLPDRQKIVFEAIKMNPGLKVPALSEIINVEKTVIENAIKGLRMKKLVKYTNGYHLTSIKSKNNDKM